MTNFLDINGVKTLKYYFEKLVESKGSSDSDIDNYVMKDGDGGNGFVTVKNGTAWGKHDIPWGWFENIVDDPTSLTLTATGGTANQAADTASEEAGEII